MFITSPLDAERHGNAEHLHDVDRYRLVNAELSDPLAGGVTLDIVRGPDPALAAPMTFSASVVLDGTLEKDGASLPRGSVLLGGQSGYTGRESAKTTVLTVDSRPGALDPAAPTCFDLNDIDDVAAHNPALGFFDMKARMLVDGPRYGARSFTLGLGTFAPGTGCHALHRHANAAEFFYVWEGAGAHLTGDGASHPISAGDLVYVPPNEWHGFRNPGTVPARAFFGYLGVDARADAGYEVFRPCLLLE